jgi:hypothetical protein
LQSENTLKIESINKSNSTPPYVPRISIVTPSYNQGDYLEECIDSVLSQNYPNLEYVIMDGGSTDNSVEIIKKYEKYLTYWQSCPDSGQYAAINSGFQKTTGDIMTWLNSDDKYHHNTFYKVAYLFSKYNAVEWLTGRTTLWDKLGNCSYIHCYTLPAFSREKYLRKNYLDPTVQQESTFWRRSLWEKAGGTIRTDLDFAGDMELWTRFFRYTQLHIVDTLLGGYRMHGNQKAVLFMDKYVEEAEKIIDEEIKLFDRGTCKELLPDPEPLSLIHEELKNYIDGAYSKSVVHPYKISDDSDLPIGYLVGKVQEFESECSKQQWIIGELQAKANDLQGSVDNLQGSVDNLQGSVDNLQVKLESSETALTMTRAQLMIVYSSLSWKVTAPLRWVLGLLLRLYKK